MTNFTLITYVWDKPLLNVIILACRRYHITPGIVLYIQSVDYKLTLAEERFNCSCIVLKVSDQLARNALKFKNKHVQHHEHIHFRIVCSICEITRT